jgi:hypothetical protein
MKEPDDLFEFGDLDDTESLEIDLDDLFGGLETLAIDIDTIEAEGAPATATPAEPAPTAAPIAAAPATAPAPAQIPQSQPVTPAPQAYTQPTLPVDFSVLSKLRLTKTSAAICFATIITLANVAVTMVTPQGSNTSTISANSDTGLESKTAPIQYDDSAMRGQLEALNAEIAVLRAQGSPTKPIPASYTKGGHPAFDDVAKNLQEGNFIAARQKLYALLAIVDRFEDLERDAIETKASYMLADAWRMEAQRTTTQGTE